jgi:hypothetical protein
MVVAVESLMLGALCLFDLISTVWLLRSGAAVEANPLLGFYIQAGGIIAFIAAKVLLTIGPLYVLEVLRRRRPRLVRTMLRIGIALYIIAYGLGGVLTNTRAEAAKPSPFVVRSGE